MASLFLILIYSIYRCKKEEKQIKIKMHVQDWVITKGEDIQVVLEISGMSSKKDDYIFEVQYEIESKFHEDIKKRKEKIRFTKEKEDGIIFTEEIQECDSYILRLKSISWEDFTGIYKVRKELDQEIYFLTMPVAYELGSMKHRLESRDVEEQGFEYDGVRSYHEGDRLSRVHWNLYASSRQLLVRKSEEETEGYIKIGLDLSEIDKNRISDYFSIFYSVSLFYMEAGFWQEIYYGEHRFLLKYVEQYEELFNDIFHEGIQKLPEDIAGVRLITLNNEDDDIQDYLYNMEL